MAKHLKTYFLVFLLLTLSIFIAQAQQKHAILIGINNYLKPTDNAVRPSCKDLTSSVNNVHAMADILKCRFDFKQSDIRFLLNEKATKSEIIKSLEALIPLCNNGDVVFFYFSGYGSQIFNAASKDSNKMEKTIVPYDGLYKGNDILEKQLNQLFVDIIDKGVTLTAIYECGHGGSSPVGVQMEEETLPPPADSIRDKKEYPNINNYGALVINAAGDNQGAYVKEYDGENFSVFTKSIMEVLKANTSNAPASDFCKMLADYIKYCGECQVPQVICNEYRSKLNFAGTLQHSDDIKATAVKINPDNTLVLQGGVALGIETGTELENENNTVRIEVTGNEGVSTSFAKIRAGSYLDLKQGAVYKITRQAFRSKPKIRISLPVCDMKKENLFLLADSIQKLTEKKFIMPYYDSHMPVDYLIYFNNSKWILRANGTNKDLGEKLNIQLLSSLIEPNKTMAVRWPLYRDLYSKISSEINKNYSCINISDLGNSDYFVSGIYLGKKVAYSLLKTEHDSSAGAPYPDAGGFSTISTANDDESAIGICESAYKLGRMKSWLTLANTDKKHDFPWIFYIKNDSIAKLIKQGTVAYNEEYKFFIFKNPAIAASDTAVKKTWVYVFDLSPENRIRLIVPSTKENFMENYLPVNDNDTILEEFGPPVYTPAFGTYNLLMLATDNPLNNPSRIEGVVTQLAADDSMEAIVDEMNSKTIGKTIKSPTGGNWSIQRISVSIAPQE